jgi:hypothetical protein
VSVVEHRVHEVVDCPTASHDGLTDVHKVGRAGAEDVHAQHVSGRRRDQELEHSVRIADDLARAASLPWSMLVAARAGKPMTSPTAKMCGTLVRYSSSTVIRPRGSALSPAASRPSSPVIPWRPAEYMTVSAAMRLPLARVVTVPCLPTSTFSTSSPNRKVTERSRRWNFRDSTTSGSQNSSIVSRFSTTVTRVPSAANIDAYSMPMTPAPTTTMVSGTRSSARIPSESTTRSSSNSTWAGRLGTGRDDDLRRPDHAAFAAAVDLHRVRVDKSRRTNEQIHVIAEQLRPHDLDLPADHVLRARQEVLDGNLLLHPVRLTVELAHRQSGQIEDGFPPGLRRDGAGVDADAANHVPSLDDADALTQLGRTDRRLLATWTGADDQQVVVVRGLLHGRPFPVPTQQA